MFWFSVKWKKRVEELLNFSSSERIFFGAVIHGGHWEQNI